LIKINQIQKLGSFFIPIKVWKGSSPVNPVLELFLFKGEWQLGTINALYSSGTRYKPLVIGFRAIQGYLSSVQNVLVLGAGLGSAPSILSEMGHFPFTTLVDIDEVIISWARELTASTLKSKVSYVVADARAFMIANQQKYDLLVVDIFNNREVPKFVFEVSFLNACKFSLNKNGHVVANYMINSLEEWTLFLNTFKSIFPSVTVIELGLNRILIAKV
jgi:predicted membrane-bound spermidine synthase